MGYSYSRGYPYSYHSAVHSLHKRSAEPEPEAEAEAEPGYLSRYHGYRSYGHRAYGHHYPAVSYSHGYPYSYHSAVHSLHKRSAEPAPEAEAEPGYEHHARSYVHVSRGYPSHYSHGYSHGLHRSYHGHGHTKNQMPYFHVCLCPLKYNNAHITK